MHDLSPRGSNPPRQGISRRGMLIAASMLAPSAALRPATGNAQGGTATPEAAGWSFPGADGESVKLDSRPASFVAYITAAAALWDYGLRPAATFGALWSGMNDRDTTISGAVDVESIPSVGQVWGEIDIEAILSLDPDLVVVPVQRGVALMEEGNLDAVSRIVPVLTVENADASLDTIIERFAAMGEAFGADLTVPEIVSEKERHAEARTVLERTMRERSEIRSMFVSADPEGLRVSRSAFPTIRTFAELGGNVVDPEEGDSAYVQRISWERSQTYEADLIFLDVRPTSLQIDALSDITVWNALPAVKAGNVFPWNPEPTMNYRGIADVYEALNAALLGASPI